MEYRIALQELGIQQLKLSSATETITAEKDPYKIIQVHDYKSISFLRQNPNVKAASTEVIKQFALAYPELLKVSPAAHSFVEEEPSGSSPVRRPRDSFRDFPWHGNEWEKPFVLQHKQLQATGLRYPPHPSRLS